MTQLAYTIDEARKLMNVSISTIYREIKRGRIKVKKAGRKTLVPAESINTWLAELPDYIPPAASIAAAHAA
jgi:excisionase family DNA binding protein